MVAGLAGIRGGNAVDFREIGDAREENGEKENNGGESSLGIFDSGFAKGSNTVADGFDAGQGRAAAGEHLEEEPIGDSLRHGRGRRKRSGRKRVPVTRDDADDARDDGDEESADKEVSGDGEDQTGFAQPTKVEDRDEDQDDEAERDGVGQQRRHRGNQRTNTGGNADGGGEDIVGEKSGSGEEARGGSEIVTGDGVRAAAGGVRGDGLAVGEVDDDKKSDDGEADRDEIADTEQAEGNQEAEGGFGAVGSGTEPVQTKNGDALRRANLLGTFVTAADGLADKEVKYVHGRPGSEQPTTSAGGIEAANRKWKGVRRRRRE